MRPGQQYARMQQQSGKDRMQYYQDTGLKQTWQDSGGLDGGAPGAFGSTADKMFGNLDAMANDPAEYNRRLMAAGEQAAAKQQQEQAMERLLKNQNVASALGGGVSIGGGQGAAGVPRTFNAGGQGVPLAKGIPGSVNFNRFNPFN